MKRNFLLLLTLIVFSLGCSNSSQNNASNNSTDSSSDVTINSNSSQPVSFDFKELTFNSTDISSDLYIGDITTGKKWQDEAGINYFFVTEKTNIAQSDYEDIKSYEIHGYHFVENNGNFNLIREIKDFETDCDLILDCGLSNNSLELTDLDDDNYGEISFLYYLYCAMDASPSDLKLMMLENGDKYPIRGETYVNYGPFSGGGETNVGDEFSNAPVSFKDFALKKWSKFQYMQSGILPEVNLLEPFDDVTFMGTEPFWDLSFNKYGFIITENVGEPERFFEYTSIGKSGDNTWNITAKEGNVYFDLIIIKENCSDGMSDNEYSYSIEVKRADKSPLYGCCCKK